MLRERKEPKGSTIAEIVLWDVQRTSAEKLVMFEKPQGPVSV